MTDRLSEIERCWSTAEPDGDKQDIDWLIAEVKRIVTENERLLVALKERQEAAREYLDKTYALRAENERLRQEVDLLYDRIQYPNG